MSKQIKVAEIEFVKELYPRLREDDAAIERYRSALDKLPPITIARGHVLVDGFHRWQAHKREGVSVIDAEDLGNLTDAEIVRESITRNASHGQQLSAADKKRLAGQLWITFAHLDGDRKSEIATLLSVSERSIENWTKDARASEKEKQQARAWDLWLDCKTQQEIAVEMGVDQKTISNWVGETAKLRDFLEPPTSRQHFDIWSFQSADGDSSYFGRMPPQIVENLLWLYTEPGDIVVDPFAGGGTTIDVAKAMGRRVWASDLHPSTPTLPIHEHDIVTGWPKSAPAKAKLVLLDPPYWRQAAGRYSDDPRCLGNLDLETFMGAWRETLKVCSQHLEPGGVIAFIVSPARDETGEVVDLALAMCKAYAILDVKRRIIVPYQTQQATGQQVEWARENKDLLVLFRDLIVMER